jgi:hypothetical protein
VGQRAWPGLPLDMTVGACGPLLHDLARDETITRSGRRARERQPTSARARLPSSDGLTMVTSIPTMCPVATAGLLHIRYRVSTAYMSPPERAQQSTSP